MSFCLYVAARVFVQYLKPRPDDVQVRSSLQFLLQAMNAIKRKNPLTESFLVQLDVDMEGAGLGSARPRNDRSTSNSSLGQPQTHQTMKRTHEGCGPTFGDQGVSKYADPNSNAAPVSRSSTATEAFGYGNQDSSTSPPFQLPDRRKTPAGFRPGAIPGGALLRSPEGGMIFDLGSSPEGSSGGGGRGSSDSNNNNNNIRTPSLSSGAGSQNPNTSTSSHTSQTGYSPPDQERQNSDPGCMGLLFAGNTDAYVEGFETTTVEFPSSTKTGFTPGASGMTPAGGISATAGGAQDFMNMTDADWNRIMDGMAGWEAGATHELSMSG